MVNFPSLDIQIIPPEVWCWTGMFLGGPSTEPQEVFFSCLGLMKMPTIICSKNPGTWNKKNQVERCVEAVTLGKLVGCIDLSRTQPSNFRPFHLVSLDLFIEGPISHPRYLF